MMNRKLQAIVVMVGMGISPFIVSAATVNVDFGAGGVYAETGAATDTGTYWNNLASAGSTGPLLESDGLTASTISVEVTADTQFKANSGGSNALLEDWLIANDSVKSFTISGLNPSLTYDIYLYGINGSYNSRSTTFSIGGNSQTTINDSAAWDEFELGSSHVVFIDITPTAGGQIVGTYVYGPFTSEGGRNIQGAINGMQIEWAEVPEPASLVLLGLGGTMMIRRRKH